MRTWRVSAPALTALGFVSGLVVGVALWTEYQDRHATALFSPKWRRRAAALGRLATAAAADATVDTVVTLREYVAWERHPLLRRRGKQLLARLASSLS